MNDMIPTKNHVACKLVYWLGGTWWPDELDFLHMVDMVWEFARENSISHWDDMPDDFLSECESVCTMRHND